MLNHANNHRAAANDDDDQNGQPRNSPADAVAPTERTKHQREQPSDYAEAKSELLGPERGDYDGDEQGCQKQPKGEECEDAFVVVHGRMR